MNLPALLSPHRLFARVFRFLGTAATVAGLMLISQIATMAQSTFTVENTGDSGPGSLRAAIAAALSTPGANTVAFAKGLHDKIVLTSGAIEITGSLTITGPGAHRMIVSAGRASRVFDIEGTGPGSIDVNISGLKITQGFVNSTAVHGSAGGGIYVSGAALTLSGVVLSQNAAEDTENNIAEGGGMAMVLGASVTATDLTVEYNKVYTNLSGTGLGGGLYVDATSSLALLDSFVTQNGARGKPGIGGGVYTLGTFSVDAATLITKNIATTSGDNIGP